MQDFLLEKSEKSVSLKQFILATFLINLTAKFVIAPIVILKTGGRSALPALLIEQGLEFLEIGLMIAAGLVMQGKTFQQILSTAYGQIIARIVCGVIAIYAVLKILLLMTFLNNFLSKGFFDGVIWAMYSLPVILLLIEFGKRSLRSIGRVTEIFGVFILISLILIIILVLKNAEFVRLLPIEGNQSGAMKRTMEAYPMWFGDYMPILIFMGNVKTGKHYKKTLAIAGAVTFALVVFSFSVIFAAYIDVAHYMDFSKKVSSVTQISVSRFNSGRVDIILYAVQMIAVIILACQYFYLSARGAEFCIGLKKPANLTSYALGIIVYVVTAFVLTHDGKAFWFFTDFLSEFAWILQSAVPVIILAGAFISRQKEKKSHGIA